MEIFEKKMKFLEKRNFPKKIFFRKKTKFKKMKSLNKKWNFRKKEIFETKKWNFPLLINWPEELPIYIGRKSCSNSWVRKKRLTVELVVYSLLPVRIVIYVWKLSYRLVILEAGKKQNKSIFLGRVFWLVNFSRTIRPIRNRDPFRSKRAFKLRTG